QIARRTVEKADGVHLIDLLANEGGVTELAAGRGARRVRAHAAGDVLVGFDREVRLELARAFVVPTAAAKETRDRHHAGFRMRFTARTISSHRLVCVVSCLRPAGVSR